jgi:RNA polymerase sigma-70 factor, ECF subfamily
MAGTTPTRQQLEQSLRELHEASWGWALSCCGRQAQDADEVLQKSYLKVLEGKARFEGRSSFRTWLFGVIRRTAQEHRRWSLVRSFWSPLSGREASPERPHDDRFEAHEHGALLLEALAGLSARQRELLHLVFYEDMSISEAAGILGVSVGTARQHYERGKANLAAELTRRGVEGP